MNDWEYSMTIPERIILVTVFIIALTIGYYIGHISARSTSDKSINTQVTTDVKQQETIVETKKPDGTITTITNINTVKDETDKTNTTIAAPRPTWNVSGLVALDSFKDITPKYGISITKEFLGLRVGAFGLTNGTAGVSLGIDF